MITVMALKGNFQKDVKSRKGIITLRIWQDIFDQSEKCQGGKMHVFTKGCGLSVLFPPSL